MTTLGRQQHRNYFEALARSGSDLDSPSWDSEPAKSSGSVMRSTRSGIETPAAQYFSCLLTFASPACLVTRSPFCREVASKSGAASEGEHAWRTAATGRRQAPLRNPRPARGRPGLRQGSTAEREPIAGSDVSPSQAAPASGSANGTGASSTRDARQLSDFLPAALQRSARRAPLSC